MLKLIPVYSPTRTEQWDQCQLKSHIQHDLHWVPRQASKALVGALCGQAFAVGMAAFHKGVTVDMLTAQALDHLRRGIDHHVKHGVLFDGPAEAIVDGSGLSEVLGKYSKENPFSAWQILDVETTLEEYGRCRIDIGGVDSDGVLAVADAKYKRNLKPEYESSTIDEYFTSWQFMHYPWAYGAYKGTPCHRMYLCLVVWKPRFYIKLVPHEIHPDTQAIWLASARQKWGRMGRTDTVPEMSTRHRDQFGWCPYYRACFQYHLDESLFGNDYVKVPRMEG